MMVGLYCTCGGAFEMEVLPASKLTEVWPEITAIWQSGHNGSEHSETDRKTATRNRERNELQRIHVEIAKELERDYPRD